MIEERKHTEEIIYFWTELESENTIIKQERKMCNAGHCGYSIIV